MGRASSVVFLRSGIEYGDTWDVISDVFVGGVGDWEGGLWCLEGWIVGGGGGEGGL